MNISITAVLVNCILWALSDWLTEIALLSGTWEQTQATREDKTRAIAETATGMTMFVRPQNPAKKQTPQEPWGAAWVAYLNFQLPSWTLITFFCKLLNIVISCFHVFSIHYVQQKCSTTSWLRTQTLLWLSRLGKGRRFYSQWGHMPRLRVYPWSGQVQDAADYVSLSHWCFSPSLSLPSFPSL